MNEQRFSIPSITFSVAALALSLNASPVAAEDSEGFFNLEEVVVTARKREESLQDTPIAVSAFSSRDMEIRGATDVTDIGAAAPNVSIESSAGVGGLSSAPTVFIRGMGQSDFVVNADPAVGVYVDGVYVARSIGSLMDLMDLERAEVLRGPQGTLFGRNTIGGAISLVSKKPSTEGVEGKVGATIGENGYYQLDGMVNLPISEQLAARGSVFKRERDGYVDALQYDDLQLGDNNVWGGRIALAYQPTDSLSFDLSYDYSLTEETPAAFVPYILGTDSENPDDIANTPGTAGFFYNNFAVTDGSCDTAEQRASNTQCYGEVHNTHDDFSVNSIWTDRNGNPITPENRVEAQGLHLTAEWDLEFATLKSISAYREFDATFYNDFDFSPVIAFHNNNSGFTHEQFSQELQIVGSAFDDKLDYVAGLYYFEEEGTQEVDLVGFVGWTPAITTTPFFQHAIRDVTNTSQAAYTQLTYHITDALHLTVGLRYTDDEKDFDAQIIRNHALFQEGQGTQTATETDPMINLSYDLDESTMLYATYSTGFRDGGFPSRFANGLATPLDFFDPEFVTAYELGIKSSWWGDKLRLNAALFQTDYEDMQIAATPSLGASNSLTIDNLGESTIQGFEAELNAVLTDTLRLDLALGYLDDDITSVKSGTLTSSGMTIDTSNDLPYTPQWTWSLGLSHAIPLDSGAEVLSRIDWIHTDDQYYRVENHAATFQEAYDRVNLSVTYTEPSERWSVGIGARNLSDEVWATAASLATDSSSTARNVSRPREIYATVKYYFGE